MLDPSTRVRTLADWLQAELSLPRIGSAETISHVARATNWAREAIENSIYKAQGVGGVLEPFPVSYRQLARYLVAEFGATPKEVQLAARIREARASRPDGGDPPTAAGEAHRRHPRLRSRNSCASARPLCTL